MSNYPAQSQSFFTSAAAPTEDSGAPTPSLRLLVVEDGIVNQKYMLTALKKRGHNVKIANHGLEALSILEKEDFDAVFMDLQMPEMDGLEATRAIREKEKTTGKHIPIIAVTARAMQSDKEKCFQAGMDGYVSKPITPAGLFAELNRVRTALGSISLHMGDGQGEGHSPPPNLKSAICNLKLNEGRCEEALHSPLSNLQSEICNLHLKVLPEKSVLLEQLDNDEAFLNSLIDMFAGEAQKSVQEIANAIQRHDARALERAAHKLKSAISNFHAQPSITAAGELENIGRTGTTAGAIAGLEKLRSELDALNRELTRMRQ